MAQAMKLLTGIETRVLNVGTLISSGLIRPMRPDHLVRIGRLYRAWGPTPALGYLAASFTRPDDTALIDELGALTFAEVNRRTNALAHALADDGIGEGDRLRPGVHRPRGRRGRGPQDLRGLGGGGRRRRRRDRDRRLARAPDPPRRPVRPGAAGRARPHGDPHFGDHRHAEGRDAPVADLRRAGGGAAVEDPAARGRGHDDRR